MLPGLAYDEVTTEVYELGDDLVSAVASCTRIIKMGMPTGDTVDITAVSTMLSNADSFTVDSTLTVLLGEETFHEQSWRKVIPREFV